MNESEWRTRKQRIDTKLRALSPQGDAFLQKITGNANVDRPRCSLSASTGERARVRCRSGIRPSSVIREFRNRPNPKVVVTVDMLSTGVDIPALEFIVFLRSVKSRILRLQMRDMNAARNAIWKSRLKKLRTGLTLRYESSG